MSITLSEIKDPKLRQRLLAALEGATPVRPPPAQTDATAPRQTPKQPLLNKTETRWCSVLEGRGYKTVWKQAIRLKLAERLHYTPDFAVIRLGVLTFYEVKGAFERDDAIVKLKAAAKLFPQFDFIKAKWANGQWTETPIPK